MKEEDREAARGNIPKKHGRTEVEENE